MASDRMISKLRDLSEAETFGRAWFDVLASYAALGALPVWLIKQYNSFVDGVNLDVAEVLAAIRTAALPTLPQPQAVPRFVLAATPNQDEILLPDEHLLGNSDLLARGVLRPSVLGVEGACDTSGQLGNPVTGMMLVRLGMRGTFWLGAIAIGAPYAVRGVEAIKGVTEQRILSRNYQLEIQERLALMENVKAWNDRCINASGGVADAKTLQACMDTVPAIMRTPTRRPKADTAGGQTLVNVGIAAVLLTGATIGGVYAWRRYKKARHDEKYAVRVPEKLREKQRAAIKHGAGRGI
jgi:hypothetical protein